MTWIKTIDQLPEKDGKDYLFKCKNHTNIEEYDVFGWQDYCQHWDEIYTDLEITDFFTHWQEIVPPKEGE